MQDKNKNMLSLVYDLLMHNTNHHQFDVDRVDWQEVDYDHRQINFRYKEDDGTYSRYILDLARYDD